MMIMTYSISAAPTSDAFTRSSAMGAPLPWGSLAVAQLEESLAVLTQRIPQLRLDRAPVISGATGIRRVDAMMVSWPV
jgi:hypothetical protein